MERIKRRKKIGMISKIIKDHYHEPISYIKRISDKFGLNFPEVIDFYLDCYNDLARERYTLYGENSIEPQYKKECMEGAFISTLWLMGFNENLRGDQHTQKLLEEL